MISHIINLMRSNIQVSLSTGELVFSWLCSSNDKCKAVPWRRGAMCGVTLE